MLTHTASSPFPGSPQEGPTTFSPQLTQRVLQKTRLRRSELADLIHVLLTPFNNHYFTLTDITDSTDITDITDYTDNTDLADFNDYMVAGGLF
jgi:hypothetical protein